MATINHKTYNEATETFKDFSVYDGKETLIFKVDGADQTVYASNIIGSGIIKTSDNGPLSATAKYLSDGLGNNSALALSTSLVGVGATTLFTKMSIANSLSATSIGTNYNAGILNIQNTNTTSGNLSLIGFQDASASINLAAVGAINTVHSASPNSVVGELGFYTKASGGGYVTERLRITSTGNVGIGTSSPTGQLHISGDGAAANLIRLQNTGSGTNGFFDISVTSTDAQLVANYSTTAIPMLFLTGAAERMRITSTGRVGIGTTADYSFNDDAKLAVANTSGNSTISIVSGTGSTGYLAFADGTSGTDRYTGSINYLHASDAMTFNTNAGNERMRITSAGAVGIGTASPAYRFNVVTDAIAGAQNLAAIDRTAQNFVTFTNPQFSTDASMGLMLRVFPQSDARQGAGILASGGAANGETDLNLFVSSGSVSSTSYSALTLKGGSGNVGIGTSAPTAKLDVNQTNQSGDNDFIRLTTDATAGSLSLGIYPSSNNSLSFIGSNALLSSGGVTRLNAAAGGSLLTMNTDSIVAYVSSGAANPVERMRITSAGNVGIGTSTPAYKLQINASGGNGLSLIGDVDNEASVLFGDSGSAAIGRLTYSNIDDSMRIFTNGTEKVRITSTGNVGIGTSTPAGKLDITGGNGDHITLNNAGERFTQISFSNNSNLRAAVWADETDNDFVLYAASGRETAIYANAAERVRITTTGNVGIGTSAPVSKLHVAAADAWMTLQRTSGTTNILDFTDSAAARLGYVGFIFSNLTLNAKAGSDIVFAPNNEERGRFTSNGLTFNGDTAAANALDDYEEGTFTPTVIGSTSAGTASYTFQVGRYTKIGRVVQFEIFIAWSGGTGTGDFKLAGLPFTSSSTGAPAATIGYFDNVALAAAGNVPLASTESNATNIGFLEIPSGGGTNIAVSYDAAGEIQVAGTYSV